MDSGAGDLQAASSLEIRRQQATMTARFAVASARPTKSSGSLVRTRPPGSASRTTRCVYRVGGACKAEQDTSVPTGPVIDRADINGSQQVSQPRLTALPILGRQP
jgi:hypothetical protein